MRVKRIYAGHDGMGEPIFLEPKATWLECDHPRDHFRFDPRYAVPSWGYCLKCGMMGISPYHGMTQEEIDAEKEAARLKIKERWPNLYKDLWEEDGTPKTPRRLILRIAKFALGGYAASSIVKSGTIQLGED